MKLALLLALSSAGIVLKHIEADGAKVFAEACRMGLEGVVSKRIDKPYRSGKSGDWVGVRNPNSAAAKRFADGQKRTEGI